MPPGTGFLDRLSGKQVALAIIAFGAALYLPMAGSYGLWDPWETHYGEVARQMLLRGDYVSLWWPGSPLDAEHFWSKPVLSFWLMAIGMKVAGLGGPGAMPDEMVASRTAEWALRVPFCMMGILGIYGVYLCTARFVGRRAGVIAAVAIATMPLYSLVARQAMTDMAFVGPMTLALALVALALFDDDDAELPRRIRRRLSWPHHSLFYGTLVLFTAVTLPQLIINSVQVRWTFTIAGRAITLPGIAVMAPYFVGFAAFVRLAARTRHKAPFYLYLAAILCGIATLAKGLAGLGLPVIILLVYLLCTWNWRRLDRAQIYYGILVAMLACAVVTFPWHNAMLVRHGRAFWEELYGDNHWRRLMSGRHGDRGTFEYFLRQLGYATLPWLSVAPAALVATVMRRFRQAGPNDARTQNMLWFGAIWFVAGYTLVSLSVTKFHHYILVALPGLAIVIGCTLDDLVRRGQTRVFAAAALIGLPVMALVVHDLASAKQSAQHFLWLFSYDYVNSPKGRPWPEAIDFTRLIPVLAAVCGACAAALAWRRVQRAALVAVCASAVVFTLFLLDVYMVRITPYWTQKNLLATYYKTRKSPEERLVSWQMYWRGETFYSKNEIWEGPYDKRTVFLGDKNVDNLKSWIARNRGRRHFFVVERARWATLQGMLPEEARGSLKMIDESNMKFCLAQADL